MSEITADQQERSKWRANERADRAEARVLALEKAATVLVGFLPVRSEAAGIRGPFADAVMALRAVLLDTDAGAGEAADS